MDHVRIFAQSLCENKPVYDADTLSVLRDICLDEGADAAADLLALAVEHTLGVYGREAEPRDKGCTFATGGPGGSCLAIAPTTACGGYVITVYGLPSCIGILESWMMAHKAQFNNDSDIVQDATDAILDGVGPDANPYPPATRQYEIWANAWTDAYDALNPDM